MDNHKRFLAWQYYREALHVLNKLYRHVLIYTGPTCLRCRQCDENLLYALVKYPTISDL